MDITDIDLFDQNAGKVDKQVRVRCTCSNKGIDLFDQNVGMAYANVRLRCSGILLVLIYLIKMWV